MKATGKAWLREQELKAGTFSVYLSKTTKLLAWELNQELITYTLCHEKLYEAHLGAPVLWHMLAVGHQAATQTWRLFSLWDCRRLGLTGLPLSLHIHVYATVCRRYNRRLWIQCLWASPGTKATLLSQITSLVHTGNHFFKEDLERATVQAAIITAALKGNMQILPATAFNSTSYRLNSLWS